MFQKVKEQLKHKCTPSSSTDKKHKTTKVNELKLQQQNNALNLSLSDCTCPICLEILIEPVRMPCKHEICLQCFETMLDKTNLCCPMCRQRVSTWSRNAANTNTLVDQERWMEIKKAFPEEIKNRIEGKTRQMLVDSLENMKTSAINQKCSEQGELRKEYLEYIKRVSLKWM